MLKKGLGSIQLNYIERMCFCRLMNLVVGISSSLTSECECVKIERRDTMNNVSNINNISKEYMIDPDFQSKMKTVLIGDALGSERIYVNIDYVKPGAESVKYHSHSSQEEFFLIISGKGLLRIDGDEILISTGSVISKPAGKDIAHQFINNSSEILQVLDVGTREKDDVITYPDENVMVVKSKGLVFNVTDMLRIGLQNRMNNPYV